MIHTNYNSLHRDGETLTIFNSANWFKSEKFKALSKRSSVTITVSVTLDRFSTLDLGRRHHTPRPEVQQVVHRKLEKAPTRELFVTHTHSHADSGVAFDRAVSMLLKAESGRDRLLKLSIVDFNTHAAVVHLYSVH